MNKSEMADAIALQFSLSKSKAQQVVSFIFDGEEGLVAKTLKQGDDVTLQGFGTFKVVTRAPRTATNPTNGAKVDVPSKTVPKFKPGKTLTDIVG